MKLMGADVDNCGDGGGISVQGDTTINNTGLKTLGTIAVILLALAAGAGATWLLLYCHKPAPVIASPQPVDEADWKLGIQVSDKP